MDGLEGEPIEKNAHKDPASSWKEKKKKKMKGQEIDVCGEKEKIKENNPTHEKIKKKETKKKIYKGKDSTFTHPLFHLSTRL